MNTFIFTMYADRIAPYTKTVELPALTNDEAGKEFVEGLYSTAFINTDNGEWVRSTAITSFKVKTLTSIQDAKEKAREVVQNFLKQNGPAVTVDSIVYMYREYYTNHRQVDAHVKAVIEANKNELKILAQEEGN